MCTNPNTRFLCRLIADVVILIGIYCTALLLLPRTLPTTSRGFFCSDTTLMYPYAGTLLSRVHITIMVIALPAACLLIVEMLCAAFRSSRSSNKHHRSHGSQHTSSTAATQRFVFVGINIPTFVSECYKIVGVYLFGLALTLIAMRSTKHFAGRLRPYFFDVCQPQLRDGGDACAAAQNLTSSFIGNYECSGLAASAELLRSVRHSFPSGYATTVSYAMCFLVLYLQARLRAPWLKILRATLQFGCATLAALVAFERLYSYRSHGTDVLAGALLGAALAAFVTITVADLFRKLPVKRRRLREDAPHVYGYYTVNRIAKYY